MSLIISNENLEQKSLKTEVKLQNYEMMFGEVLILLRQEENIWDTGKAGFTTTT